MRPVVAVFAQRNHVGIDPFPHRPGVGNVDVEQVEVGGAIDRGFDPQSPVIFGVSLPLSGFFGVGFDTESSYPRRQLPGGEFGCPVGDHVDHPSGLVVVEMSGPVDNHPHPAKVDDPIRQHLPHSG